MRHPAHGDTLLRQFTTEYKYYYYGTAFSAASDSFWHMALTCNAAAGAMWHSPTGTLRSMPCATHQCPPGSNSGAETHLVDLRLPVHRMARTWPINYRSSTGLQISQSQIRNWSTFDCQRGHGRAPISAQSSCGQRCLSKFLAHGLVLRARCGYPPPADSDQYHVPLILRFSYEI
jgi:hypothetical protein